MSDDDRDRPMLDHITALTAAVTAAREGRGTTSSERHELQLAKLRLDVATLQLGLVRTERCLTAVVSVLAQIREEQRRG